jgi:hypothetical protein
VRRASPLQRTIERFTAKAGSPGFAAALTVLVVANRHEQLVILELAMLSEQKAAKIISLLEQLRQDHPQIHDRIDKEADAMSSPTDSRSILEALKYHTKTLSTD